MKLMICKLGHYIASFPLPPFQEIMMDHSLRSISYIADIGDLLVIMARRRPQVPSEGEDAVQVIASTPKMICHVFESDEVQNET